MGDVGTIKSSEDIVADLLNDVKSSDTPFSVDKLAGMVESETNKTEKKHKKHKKHKKSKKKKSSSKHRSRSRSKSPSRKHKKRKRRHSSSSSYSENIKEEKIPTDPLVSKETVPLIEPQPCHSNQDTMCADDFKPLIPKVEDDFETKLLVKKEVKLSININTVPQNVVKKEEDDEKEEGEIVNTGDENISNKKAKRRHRSTSRNTDEIVKKKVYRKRSRSRDKKDRHRKTSHSPSGKLRGREENRHDVENERGDDRSKRRKSRSSSRNRRRTYSKDRERRNRRSRSRDERFDRRRKSRTPPRRRSRSREYIDKEKLLEIAKKNRARMYATGEQRSNATVEDFVTYCQRLQKRQEKEKRRERGEAVSSDDDSEPDVQYKHPYALPLNNPIRINIVTSATATLAQKALTAPEEKELGASELRVLFPVSSGAVHKENAEWTPVVKDDVPKSCTNEQKKHVALTSFEIERCKLQGIPVPQPSSAPTFLHSILPPPPPPPQFISNPSSPPPLPQVLYLPPKEKLIIKEPTGKMPAPKDLSETLKLRVEAQRRLATNPNDFDAHRNLREANERMEAWAALKSLPGEYTGTTGLKLLTPEELQPMNPKYHAWVKRVPIFCSFVNSFLSGKVDKINDIRRMCQSSTSSSSQSSLLCQLYSAIYQGLLSDQFKKAAPQLGGVGQRLMEKMGWKPGEGLGKEADGNLEPLTLDVKSDRKGLMAEQEMSTKQRNKLNGVTPAVADFSNKNPISLLMELCAKRRWPVPQFTCEEIGKDAQKQFIWTVAVNNALYRPIGGSKSKKEGKTVVAQVALQSMGVLPRDPNLPVFM